MHIFVEAFVYAIKDRKIAEWPESILFNESVDPVHKTSMIHS